MDDELYIQELYENMLPMAGHEIVGKAANGQEAVEAYVLLAPRPDLVIMDHRMPLMNGLDACRAILEADPGARILMISADPSVRPHAAKIGVAAFLEKPFAMDVLLRMVTKSTVGNPPAPA